MRLLVAGCGTGVETLGVAAQIVGVRVTAVDLSLSSPAYAQRMANELGVTNVEFRQADILELAGWPESFDIVYCEGVLMAMRDPQAGLRGLLSLVRPGGLLKLGLYSMRARAASMSRMKSSGSSNCQPLRVRFAIFDSISTRRSKIRL